MWNTLTLAIMSVRWLESLDCSSKVLFLKETVCESISISCFGNKPRKRLLKVITFEIFSKYRNYGANENIKGLLWTIMTLLIICKVFDISFQVNTNPLLKHTVTLSVVGKSLNCLKDYVEVLIATETFLYFLIMNASDPPPPTFLPSLITIKLARKNYLDKNYLEI